jgi:hypothetical protein
MRSDAHTTAANDGNVEQSLDLSETRAYDCALDILEAHKLTGNFHTNLEIVLKDLGALGRVTFEIEPKSPLVLDHDRRHVVFRPSDSVRADGFIEIMRSVKGRIGCDAPRPWWARVFH